MWSSSNAKIGDLKGWINASVSTIMKPSYTYPNYRLPAWCVRKAWSLIDGGSSKRSKKNIDMDLYKVRVLTMVDGFTQNGNDKF